MKTPSEFQKALFSHFNNGDLGNDLESHLRNCQDNEGEFEIAYGVDKHASKEQPYYIDLAGTGYFYTKRVDRDFDIALLKKTVIEFRRVNNINQIKIGIHS